MKQNVKFLKKWVLPVIFVVAVVYMLMQVYLMLRYNEPKMEYSASNGYEETLTVVARSDFAPYSFVDENGDLCGYNVEMIYLIAEKLNMNVDIQLYTKEVCMEKIASGQADIICNANYSPAFEDICLLSSPTGKHRIVVFGLEDYGTIHDLYEKKMAWVMDSPVDSDLHMQLGFTRIMEYYTYEDAFEAVMCGEADYIIGTYAILEYLTNTEGYPELKAVSAIINTEAFALGISKDNEELQHRVNIALSTLDNEGIYEAVANKWLGQYASVAVVADAVIDVIPVVLLSYTLLVIILLYTVVLPLYRRNQRDKATKLYDKVATRKMVERKLGGRGALMVIDINKFKVINDTYGHAVGDVVIHDVADALRKCTRASDVVGRIGGDEFLVYLPKLEFESDALHKATQIQQEVIEKTKNNTQGTLANISVGIAFHDEKETYDTLFGKADKALYDAKKTKDHVAMAMERRHLQNG